MFTSIGLKILNREASSPKNKPGLIVESLQLQAGQAIADIGSGGGYFTLEFARKVGKKGKVYAVDVRAKNLEFIKREAERKGVRNISLVLASENDANLRVAGLDFIFARNVFHHLPEPARYFRHLGRSLKTGAKAAIIEHKGQRRFSFVTIFKHYTHLQEILENMEDAGYFLLQQFDFLPDYTYTLFGVKSDLARAA